MDVQVIVQRKCLHGFTSPHRTEHVRAEDDGQVFTWCTDGDARVLGEWDVKGLLFEAVRDTTGLTITAKGDVLGAELWGRLVRQLRTKTEPVE